MNIALIGVSGRVGSRLLSEMLARNHAVTGIARHVEDVPSRKHLTLESADANEPAQLAPRLRGHDVVASAMKFVPTHAHALIAAVKQANVKRLVVVGGAGTLEIAPGRPLMGTPDFPDAYKPEAEAGRAFLDVLRGETELDWTFLSPSAEFVPGTRTGTFRLGRNQLLVGADGKSWISMEDFAIAFVDELEKPTHRRERFTVGY